MLAVDMVFPGNVLDVKSTLRDATDEALVFHFMLLLIDKRSLISKGIDDDTEEDVEEDNVDD